MSIPVFEYCMSHFVESKIEKHNARLILAFFVCIKSLCLQKPMYKGYPTLFLYVLTFKSFTKRVLP